MTRAYSPAWEDFLKAGGKIGGSHKRQQSPVNKSNPGNYLLCYITTISHWLGIPEFDSTPYKDNRIGGEFPCRLPVKGTVQLNPKTAVPVKKSTR